MKIVSVGKNLFQIEGITNAFRNLYPKDKIIIKAIEIDCKDKGQSINNDIYLCARNKVINAKKSVKKYDYIVAHESGIIKQLSNWFCTEVMYLEDKNGNFSWGIGPCFPIPKEYFNKILNTSFKDVLDDCFGGDEGIRCLTNSNITRAHIIEDATMMALSKFNWPK